MTKDSEWGEPLTGPEIKALGLPGDTPVSADNMPLPLRDWALLSDTPFYRLPADHPAYIVHRYNKEHGTNFVYWEGDDKAPDDWDGGRVLYVCGDAQGDGMARRWRAWSWMKSGEPSDIIGYTKKPQLVTEEASEPRCETRMVSDNMVHIVHGSHSFDAPANHGPAADDKGEAGKIGWMNDLAGDLNKVADIAFGPEEAADDAFTPCERTVRMCIGALPDLTVGHPNFRDGVRACIFKLDALLPKPDRAEELVNGYVREVYPNWGHIWVEGAVADELKFARWLIERGEIKG